MCERVWLLGLVLGPLVTAMVIGLFDAYAGSADIIGTVQSNETLMERGS